MLLLLSKFHSTTNTNQPGPKITTTIGYHYNHHHNHNHTRLPQIIRGRNCSRNGKLNVSNATEGPQIFGHRWRIVSIRARGFKLELDANNQPWGCRLSHRQFQETNHAIQTLEVAANLSLAGHLRRRFTRGRPGELVFKTPDNKAGGSRLHAAAFALPSVGKSHAKTTFPCFDKLLSSCLVVFLIV